MIKRLFKALGLLAGKILAGLVTGAARFGTGIAAGFQ